MNEHPGQTLIADENYFGRAFENDLTERDLVLLRPARKGEARRAGQQLLKPLRQVVESVNWTLEGQLDRERHSRSTPAGIIARGTGHHPGTHCRERAPRKNARQSNGH